MISFTSEQWYQWIAAFLWPLFRFLGLFMADPFFRMRQFPRTVKVGLAFLTTVLIAPTLPPMPAIPPASYMGLFILLEQVLIGIMLAVTIRIVFAAIEMAGNLIGTQMGLGFAMFYDPQNAAQVPLLAQLTGMFAMLMFISLNGHLLMINLLAESFQILPISTQSLAAEGWQNLAHWGKAIFSLGLILSLPMMTALLVTNLVVGVMSRAAPQMNIFGIGFAINLGVGVGLFYLALPYLRPAMEASFDTYLGYARQLLTVMR